MRTLALDPGAPCGYAWVGDAEAARHVGVWDFSCKARGGPATAEERAFGINERLEGVAPERIVIGAMGGHPGLAGSHVCAITDAVVAWARAHEVAWFTVFRSEVNRIATGDWRASPAHLVYAARKELGYTGSTPKEASAIWILATYLRNADA
jgi:hypothetical protein